MYSNFQFLTKPNFISSRCRKAPTQEHTLRCEARAAVNSAFTWTVVGIADREKWEAPLPSVITLRSAFQPIRLGPNTFTTNSPGLKPWVSRFQKVWFQSLAATRHWINSLLHFRVEVDGHCSCLLFPLSLGNQLFLMADKKKQKRNVRKWWAGAFLCC